MFHDYTNFNNADWNDWSTPLADGELELAAKEGGFYLEYSSPKNSAVPQVLLLKTFTGLTIGSEYVISVRLSRRSEPGTGNQFVHFAVDGQPCKRWAIEEDEWQRFVCTFTASEERHEISLCYEHEASTNFLGGNFQINNLCLLDEDQGIVDCTDFAGSWGDWEQRTNGYALERLPKDENPQYVGFEKPTAVLGELLAKGFALEEGRTYEFHVDARLAGFDVTTVSHLYLSGHSISASQPVTTSGWRTLVWPFVASDSKNITLSCSSVLTLQPAGLMIDDLNIYEVYREVTDFSGDELDEQLNGWILNEKTTDRVAVVHEDGEGNVLSFPTHPGFDHHGIILSKRYSGMAPGVSFRFEMRVRSINSINNAILSVKSGAELVIDETRISNRAWQYFSGTFVANESDIQIDISNSTVGSDGNDYRFSELHCYSVET